MNCWLKKCHNGVEKVADVDKVNDVKDQLSGTILAPRRPKTATIDYFVNICMAH